MKELIDATTTIVDGKVSMLHAIRWFSVDCYALFERVGYDEARKIVIAADESSMGYPLHEGGRTFELPHLGEVSCGKVIAVMAAFLVWTQWKAGRNLKEELPDLPLLRAAVDGHDLWRLSDDRDTDRAHQGD